MCVSTIAEFIGTGWLFNIQYDLSRYLIAAPLVYLIVHVVFRSWFRRRRIQDRTATRRDLWREFGYSILTAAVFALVGVSIFAGAEFGVMDVHDDIDARGWAYFAASVVAVIVAHDAYFYWTHRLMHHRRLFRLVHRAHHRSHTPTPFAAYAFGPIEAAVQAAFLPLFLLIMPMSGLAIFIFLAHMIIRNAIGHSGHEWFPRGTVGNRWFGWINAVTHHDLHHESARGNYGLYFTWWDRLMGTEHPDYRRRFDAVTRPRPAATTSVA